MSECSTAKQSPFAKHPFLMVLTKLEARRSKPSSRWPIGVVPCLSSRNASTTILAKSPRPLASSHAIIDPAHRTGTQAKAIPPFPSTSRPRIPEQVLGLFLQRLSRRSRSPPSHQQPAPRRERHQKGSTRTACFVLSSAKPRWISPAPGQAHTLWLPATWFASKPIHSLGSRGFWPFIPSTAPTRLKLDQPARPRQPSILRPSP
jgi:hypothetical protein